MVRKAVVAGQFYPGRSAQLEKDVASLMKSSKEKKAVTGIVVPHAGYIYSGGVAGSVYARITVKPTAVLLGPNHTGYGDRYSMMSTDSWQTPLGEVAIDDELAQEILKTSSLITENKRAHLSEHSLEVQLPFLQKANPDVRIVPIAIADTAINGLIAAGQDIAAAIKALRRDVVIIASSDMTHYEEHEAATAKDRKAIDAILKLDETELVRRVQKDNISMCGFAPTAVMLATAKALGAHKAELIQYQTSGDVSGDYSSVVGYAGIIVT
jgi:AmmeMemoRadiSam system protein B